MTEEPQENFILRILVAGGREAVDLLDETGLPGDEVDVFVAGNGAGAMCELTTSAYDLVIIDHSVSRVDGLRLTALIRTTPAISMLPILLIVEADDQLSRLEGYRVGAEAVFQKPVDTDQLAKVIDEIVGDGQEAGG